jgi:hypothetical protein
MPEPPPPEAAEENPPAYEDLPHMVRRIIREELQPVIEGLSQLHQAITKDGPA